MVQAYLRSMRGRSRSTNARSILRKELAKFGRDPDFVDFDCYSLCMECGHLVEPPTTAGDPMRSDPGPAPVPKSCPACGAQGLADLRHTPTAFALSSFEKENLEPVWTRYAALAVAVTTLLAFSSPLIADMIHDTADIAVWFEGSFLLLLLALLVVPFLPSRNVTLVDEADEGAGLPRRWRLPRLGKGLRSSLWRAQAAVRGQVRSETGDLLRSPLSGQPCVAYEVAVGPCPSPDTSMSGWTLLEQDNVEFHVGGTEVPARDALLSLPRKLVWSGVLTKQSEAIQRFMRMRGLLDSEEVYIYETVLVPGDRCSVEPSSSEAPARVAA